MTPRKNSENMAPAQRIDELLDDGFILLGNIPFDKVTDYHTQAGEAFRVVKTDLAPKEFDDNGDVKGVYDENTLLGLYVKEPTEKATRFVHDICTDPNVENFASQEEFLRTLDMKWGDWTHDQMNLSKRKGPYDGKKNVSGIHYFPKK